MIRVLEKNVSDKIAAGEVIERPSSIVKELVENSVDAGADSISIEIKKGGKTFIRITDNGCGIPSGETETAFLRHATSKITHAEDLDSLHTLGFRGEALASIAAVSRMSMITKTEEEKAGTRIVLEGGAVTEKSLTGCPKGTTITVRDLFYNTPARAKFLRSDAAETGSITQIVRSIAMAYDNIGIRMVSNDRVLFATHGSGDRLDTITACCGAEIGNSLVPVSGTESGMKLSGYVSGTGESRASRKEQIFFVNGRVVESRPIEKGIAKAYRDKLFSGRYPIAYLFLGVDPGTIDVNIHPNKKEIRFDDERAVTEFIRRAINEALTVREAIPDMDIPTDIPADAGSDKNPSGETPDAPSVIREQPASFVDGSDAGMSSRRDSQDLPAQKGSSADPVKKEQPEPAAGHQISFQETAAALRKELSGAKGSGSDDEKIVQKQKVSGPFDFDRLRAKGIVFDTYITAQDEDSFYLIDQHAAHERINFEKIMRGIENCSGAGQLMLTPVLVEAGFQDSSYVDLLNDMGYEIDEFGPSTWRVKAIPAFMDEKMAREFLEEYIQRADDPDAMEINAILDRAASKACKASVKGNDVLSMEEAEQLLSDLAECSNPFNCPHGRPTFIKMSRNDIEKRFKRT